MCVACGCSALYDFAAVRAAVEPRPCGHELDSTATQPGMGFALPCGLGLSICMYSASTGDRLPPSDRDIGVESLNLRVEACASFTTSSTSRARYQCSFVGIWCALSAPPHVDVGTQNLQL